MAKTINRRKFLTDTSLSAAGILIGNHVAGCKSKAESEISSYDLMKEVLKYRKIDAHAHIYSSADQTPEWHLDFADRLGIEKLQISRPSLPFQKGGLVLPETPEQVRECNDLVYKAMKSYPDRFIGFFTLNPLMRKESQDEIKRCADLGFAGYKGAWQLKLNDPLYYPVIERLIDLKMICYMHTELQLGAGGYRMKYDIDERPLVTIPEDMVEAAKRYPQAMFQWAHIASGDFEYICKCIKDCPNIYVDISGSNNDEKQVDYCIEQLGEDRIFFGSDNSYYQAVGKIFASNATESQRRKIFFDNYNNVLRKGGHGV
jgi:predicted TIM-barrel fold metal-dependent hydrolase